MSYGTPETKDKKFRDDPVRVVHRHWLCPKDGCNGEMIGTGKGMTTLHTEWENRCDKCGYVEWTRSSYPFIAHLED